MTNKNSKVEKAFKAYQESPWRHFSRELNLKDLLEMEEGKALEVIRRAEITAFHMEEAANGDI
jgi:hypothetical protein